MIRGPVRSGYMGEDNKSEPSRREASAWMIALQERPDDAALHDRFETWRRLAGNRAAWQEIERVSDRIRQVPRTTLPIVPSADVIRRSRRIIRKPAMLTAAALCGALMIGGDVLPSMAITVETGTGELREVRLADGSRMTLAPGSSVALNDMGGREVRLLRGMAFFDVTHDDARPFHVVAGDVVAMDLGTAFDVVRDGSSIRIAVRDGMVASSCARGRSDPATLRAGQTRTIDCAAGTESRGHVAPAAVASWTRGRLVATDRSLNEVVAALRPWHPGWLLTRGRSMERRVTGVYDLRDPDRALAAIAAAHGVTIRKITPWFTVLSAD